MGAQAEVRRTIGNCQAVTASTVSPVSTACLTAQRRAARDDGEPSTPTTILVLPADITIRSFRASAYSYSQLPSLELGLRRAFILSLSRPKSARPEFPSRAADTDVCRPNYRGYIPPR